MIEGNRRGRIAGNHCKARMIALDQSAKQRRNATGQLGVALLAVGEAGAVGRIDDRGIGSSFSVGPRTDSPPTPESKKRIGAFASTAALWRGASAAASCTGPRVCYSPRQ